jgi:hypothetical protein
MLVAVTDHAVERFRQRIAGSLDPRAEIVRRVTRAVEAGRVQERERGTVDVRDVVDRSLIFVCRRQGAELVVVTLWEKEGGVAPPRVPRRFTDALEKRPRR